MSLSSFFKMRNPFVGLLDETLHTPEYVYSASFTLFSVMCALGCAVSLNPRDRALYPVLLSLATGNISWCVAAPVKSLEIIQAIINMQFWAPISARQSDDPYWLCLVHVSSCDAFVRKSRILMLVTMPGCSAGKGNRDR